jgi:hypothetical protein
MKCEEVDAVMIDYLDNNVDQKLKEEIEKHLSTCEKCLDELNEDQQLLQLISKNEIAIPDDSLKINFYHMLHSEISRLKGDKNNISRGKTKVNFGYISIRIAAGIALFISGTLIGLIINSQTFKSHSGNEIIALQSEVASLKKSVILTMLNQESSSERIQAVNYTDQLDNPDIQIIEALFETLNNDKNVNVRLAAAYALSKYANQHQVVDSLVKSLSHQDDPIVQVTLINILVEKKEKSAIQPIQQIITDKTTLKEVKEVAESGVKLLI